MNRKPPPSESTITRKSKAGQAGEWGQKNGLILGYPKERRFGTAQALAKRLSLRAHREELDRNLIQGHDSPAFILLPIITTSGVRLANHPAHCERTAIEVVQWEGGF
jgi:hypothetical protein|uniref:hypothetical protein n=1 Tax=Prosthecobacter sp. TaxID=1965333 RepID=UPI0037851D86